VLAALLFVKEIASTTRLDELEVENLPAPWRVFSINGPLFFAAADRIFAELAIKIQPHQHVILHMGSVTMMDAGGLAALRKLMDQCEKNNTRIALTNLQRQPLKNLVHAKLLLGETLLEFYSGLDEALAKIKN
jgi:SulP family sulfate permease